MQASRHNGPGIISTLVLPRAALLTSLFMLKLALDFAYFAYLQIEWDNHFLTPFTLDFSIVRFVASYFILIPIAFMAPKSKNDFRTGFSVVYLAFFLMPLLTCYGLDTSRSTFALLLAVASYFLTLIFATLQLSRISLPRIPSGENFAIGLSFLFIGSFIVLAISSGSLEDFSLSLEDVYERREAATGTLDSVVFSYINVWAQKIFTPFVLAYTFIRRRWIIFSVFFMIEIAFFGITAHRQFLLYPFFVVGVILAVRSRYGINLVPGLIAAMTVLVTIAYQFYGLQDVAALLIRRTLFVPASVYYDWIEFFSVADHVYWTDNLVRSFITSEYSREPLPWYIGYYVSNGYEVAFNSGMPATGFAHAGVLGVVLYSLILGQIIKLVNTLIDNGVDVALAMAVLLPPLRAAIADSELTTALLSHGLAVGILVLMLTITGEERAKPTYRTAPLAS